MNPRRLYVFNSEVPVKALRERPVLWVTEKQVEQPYFYKG